MTKPGNVRDELRKLVAGIEEVRRRGDPERAFAQDCKWWRPTRVCSPRVGGLHHHLEIFSGEQCPATCDCFSPKATQ